MSLDGPLTLPDRIQIGLTAPVAPPPSIDIDQIAEQISRKLNLNQPGPGMTMEINRYRDEVERLERRLNDLSGDLAARKAVEEVERRQPLLRLNTNRPSP